MTDPVIPQIQLIASSPEANDGAAQKGATPTISASFYRLLLTSLEQFAANALMTVRTSDVEAIHQTRVYSRRLQSELELLPPELGAQIKPLRRKLRRARRALNDARNYDVFLELLDQLSRGRRS